MDQTSNNSQDNQGNQQVLWPQVFYRIKTCLFVEHNCHCLSNRFVCIEGFVVTDSCHVSEMLSIGFWAIYYALCISGIFFSFFLELNAMFCCCLSQTKRLSARLFFPLEIIHKHLDSFFTQ